MVHFIPQLFDIKPGPGDPVHTVGYAEFREPPTWNDTPEDLASRIVNDLAAKSQVKIKPNLEYVFIGEQRNSSLLFPVNWKVDENGYYRATVKKLVILEELRKNVDFQCFRKTLFPIEASRLGYDNDWA